MRRIIVSFIRIYQRIVSFTPIRVCRFYPSCSEYMAQSIMKKGVIKGLLKGCLRIIRCNPFNPGGYDPVG